MALTVQRIRERLQIVTDKTSGSSSSSSSSSNTTTGNSSSSNKKGQQHWTKVIVWAHNSHIGNSAATARGGLDFTRNENWNLGQMVRHVTERSFALGFDTSSGTVTALKNGSDSKSDEDDSDTQTYGLRQPIDNSSEQLCHQVCQQLKCDAFYLPLLEIQQQQMKQQKEKMGTGIPVDAPNPQQMLFNALHSRIPQRYVGVHYHPENELRSHYTDGSLIGQYDALVFVDQTTALPVLSPQELKAGVKAASAISPAKSSNYGVRRLMQEYVK